jgi:hypothetical protein
MERNMGNVTRRRKVLLTCIAGVATSVVVSATGFARVTIDPKIAVRQTFSDNIGLTTGGKNAGMVTTISPGISVGFDGRHLQGSIDYALDYRIGEFAKITDKVRHNLSARINSELIDDWFYVEGGALATVLSQDQRGARSGNLDNNNPNTNNVFSAYVQPVLRHRLNDFARLETGYKFSLTNLQNRNFDPLGSGDPLNSARQLGADSRSHEAFATLSSGDYFQRFRWSVDAAYTAENIDELNEKYRSKRVVLDGEVPFNRYVSLVGSAGYENLTDTTDQLLLDANGRAQCVPGSNPCQLQIVPGVRSFVVDQKGLIWDAGLRLTPSHRSELTVRGGRRYGDNVFNVNGFHQISPKTRLSVSYGETLDSLGRLVTQQLGSLTTSYAAGERLRPIYSPFTYRDPVTGLELNGSLAINSATFASRTGRISLDIDRLPWRGNVSIYRQDRRLLRLTPAPGQSPLDLASLGGKRDVSYGLGFGLQRSFSKHQQLLLDLIAEKNTFVLSQGRKDKFISGSLGYNWNLGKQLQATSRLTHSRRTSNIVGGNLSETAATIGLQATF